MSSSTEEQMHQNPPQLPLELILDIVTLRVKGDIDAIGERATREPSAMSIVAVGKTSGAINAHVRPLLKDELKGISRQIAALKAEHEAEPKEKLANPILTPGGTWIINREDGGEPAIRSYFRQIRGHSVRYDKLKATCKELENYTARIQRCS